MAQKKAKAARKTKRASTGKPSASGRARAKKSTRAAGTPKKAPARNSARGAATRPSERADEGAARAPQSGKLVIDTPGAAPAPASTTPAETTRATYAAEVTGAADAAALPEPVSIATVAADEPETTAEETAWEDAEAPPVLLDSGFDGSLFGDARFLDDLEILVEAEKRVTDQELGLLGEYRARGEPRSDATIDEVPDLAELRTFLGGVLGTDTPPPQQRRIGVHVAIAFVAGLALGVLLGLAV